MAIASRADRTAWLLLWHLREPARYLSERRRDARPPDTETVLKLALGRRVTLTDPALAQVGAATLRVAAATYVRRQFFRPDATPYQTLGLPPFATDRAIKTSFRLLMQLVHPDRQRESPEWPDAFAARANRAYAVLRDADARSRLDDDEKARARADEACRSAPRAEHRPPPAMPMARRRPPPPALPEWLTAGVGGFVRAHPAGVAFSALIAVALLLIGVAAREGQDTALTRDSRGTAAPAVAPVAARGAESTAVIVVQNAVPPAAPLPALPPLSSPGVAERDAAPASPFAPLDAPAPPLPAAARTNAIRAAVPALPGQPLGNAGQTTGWAQPPVAASPPPAEPVKPPAEAAVPRYEAPTPAAVAAAPSAEPVSRPVVAPVPLATAPEAAQTAVLPAARRPPVAVPATSRAPTTDEIEVLFVALVDAYERGRADSFAALFADDVQAGERRGRAAIRLEYDDLFRRSDWRRMQLTRVSWRSAGDAAQARAEAAVRIGWRDGGEVEQRIALDVELARRGGRVVITRMSQQGAP